MLVAYPIIYRVLAPSQVVGNGISEPSTEVQNLEVKPCSDADVSMPALVVFHHIRRIRVSFGSMALCQMGDQPQVSWGLVKCLYAILPQWSFDPHFLNKW